VETYSESLKVLFCNIYLTVKIADFTVWPVFVRIMVQLQQNSTQEIGLLTSDKKKEIVTDWEQLI